LLVIPNRLLAHSLLSHSSTVIVTSGFGNRSFVDFKCHTIDDYDVFSGEEMTNEVGHKYCFNFFWKCLQINGFKFLVLITRQTLGAVFVEY